MFQKIVNRNYTEGFVGQVNFGGPYRAKSARITSATGNLVGLAFGVSGEVDPMGTTQAVMEMTAEVGGLKFLGVLGNPQHYALNGTQSGGPLAPSDELPQGSEGEFFDMVTGMVVYLYNETTAPKAVSYGDILAYAGKGITGAQNPQGVPVGGIISLSPGTSIPAGFVAIPNSFVRNPVNLAASAAGAPVATPSTIQMTN